MATGLNSLVLWGVGNLVEKPDRNFCSTSDKNVRGNPNIHLDRNPEKILKKLGGILMGISVRIQSVEISEEMSLRLSEGKHFEIRMKVIS